MALGKLFRRFSLNALGRRWMKRFGRNLRHRFLRQDVHRKWMRIEPLEERSLLTGTVIYWLGTNSATNQNWSGDNWTNASGGTVVTGLKPGVGDTLVFDTTQMHFNDTPSSFAPINDMNATVTGL